jgi:hypothetical protein
MTSLSPLRCFSTSIVLAGAVIVVARNASAQTYKIDDGTPGYALSYALPDDFCWMNRLTANGTVTLTSIEAILGDAPNGRPVTLCVWRDLGGNGDPSQGLLLTQVHAIVKNSGQQTFALYEISPTQVTGSFFVGAYLTTNGNFSPATLDPHTPTLARSWFCTAYGPGTFDPTFTGNWTWYGPPTVGVQGVFMLRANGVDGPSAETYCVAKTNSLGCVPSLTFSGTPSASAGSGFDIQVSNVLSNRNGMFFYGVSGRQALPFHGGTLCVAPPLHRTAAQSSGGNPTTDCSGVYAIDFNAWIGLAIDPRLVAGTAVDGQFWSRDSGFAPPDNLGLSRGIHFGLTP